MKKAGYLLLLLFVVSTGYIHPQDSVTRRFYSPKYTFEQLDRKPVDSTMVFNTMYVYTPKGYKNSNKKYPLVYLLHGWAGSSRDWKQNYDVQKLADKYGMIIVLPDGYYDSWYVNSSSKKMLQYESAFKERIRKYIEDSYRVDPKNRFITGLSMGGHGAVTFYLKNRGYFKAAGSMSGILDITKFSDKWGISKRLGAYKKNKKTWENNSALHLLKNYKGKKQDLLLFVACGKKDFAFKVNESFNKEAKAGKVPIFYLADKGDHNWDYWTSHVDQQMLFFSLVAQGKKPDEIKKIMKL